MERGGRMPTLARAMRKLANSCCLLACLVILVPRKQSMGTRVLLHWLGIPGMYFVELSMLDEKFSSLSDRFGMQPPV